MPTTLTLPHPSHHTDIPHHTIHNITPPPPPTLTPHNTHTTLPYPSHHAHSTPLTSPTLHHHHHTNTPTLTHHTTRPTPMRPHHSTTPTLSKPPHPYTNVSASNLMKSKYLSLILMFVSVIGSYWNLISWRCNTGGNLPKLTPFSASC